MLLKTTGASDHNSTFRRAIFQGLAPDGGLYHPSELLDLNPILDRFDSDVTFQELAARLTYGLLQDELTMEQAQRICSRAFSFSPILVELDKSVSILELFHGPSCAFKDYGASFLASCMEEFLDSPSGRVIILTATSGDTGSAVARAFYGSEGIDVVILYPSNRVSPLQEKQLTTLGGNITALEVEGSFDDCQRMVKSSFTDSELNSKLVLTSANSINIGRLIPQAFYYIWGWLKQNRREFYYAVPSGNFGNLTAGVLASTWGMKVPGFLAVTNQNDVVPEYLATGVYTPRASVQTLSNAMDVGAPSNLDRLRAIFSDDWRYMAEKIHYEVVSDAETLVAISDAMEEYGYTMDPHTAVGYVGAMRMARENPDSSITLVATAHPGKFPEVMERALGDSQRLPQRLEELLQKRKESIKISNSVASLRSFLMDKFAHGNLQDTQ